MTSRDLLGDADSEVLTVEIVSEGVGEEKREKKG